MFSIDDILSATGGKLVCGTKNVNITGITTDSRTVKNGDLFIPLKGQNFDGHDFIWQALENGAVAVMSSKDLALETSKVVIKVDDTLVALQRIAEYHRRRFDRLKVIGVTGSTGKTTTKEMISCILSQKYNILKTKGNYNNQIGLPLTILNLKPEHDIAVLEMGMSSFGEIRNLKNIAKPDIAVYTNIGISHIEKLGSRENILRAKLEMIEDFTEDDYVVLNADDDMLLKAKENMHSRVITYGVDRGDIRAFGIEQRDKLHFNVKFPGADDGVLNVEIDTYGKHNVYNALAAIAVGFIYKLDATDIITGLRDYRPEKMRLNIVKTKDLIIIDDAYNASPDSMKAAIDVLHDIGKDGFKTIAVLGDMKELGDYSYIAHRDVGKYVHQKGIDILVSVGRFAGYIADGALECGMEPERIYKADDNREAIELLKKILKKGDVILVKGSRAMMMEEITSFLRREEICEYLPN
ncbi:UDP-N-acetylmuramoyl-tripeptide--D-alanyl-D-alanine ligase [Caldanaerobius fijiensis DSM 17918]|uniref:UDP-N-acetylmuramoyl-tripeptide--D-alanyl-D-alanine ligase n=1 Tax=Caldanaerobius fijiensis DSM 17918 TaxID=1121256 RepID=A0A1M4T2P2_9THEO|nr:UDP-N-acetylmuramoyl-tripeptide--D-alanyl-D-alanine ligase [Caldanaerobius fijiensis]SHE38726.1 UDP-N-acetylmuramoyl-tripeptide--D-alanyl-D-alanine ligase [Caldanaerobius fijiensis DSM 17918]